jgi:soluble lytic murein transglycosylase-like protein
MTKWKNRQLVSHLLIAAAPFATAPGVRAAVTDPLAPARAIFDDGRELRVERTEFQGDWTLLHLDDGGAIGVPAERLRRLEPLPAGRAPRHEAPPAPAQPIASASSALEPPWAGAAPPTSWLNREAFGLLPLITAAARQHALFPDLIAAMVKVESNFNPRAVSRRGAQGLLQLMPETARLLGVSDPFDPWQNLEGGSRYLRLLLDRFRGDLVLALAAYNAGEKAVEKHGGLPPFTETRQYVDRVLDYFARGF